MDKVRNERNTITNIKAILITLVVFGHFIQLMPSFMGVRQGIIIWIYSFHMPAFVFISGYLSKNVEKRRDKAFAELFIPFMIFQVLFGLTNVLLSGSSKVFTNLLHPEWAIWYLLALFIWRYTLPDVIKIRGAIWIAVIVSVLTGYLPKVSNAFAAQRTFGYFCFFLFGYYCKKETIEKIRYIKPWIAVAGLITQLVFYIVIMRTGRLNFSKWWNIFSHQAVYDQVAPWRMGIEYIIALLVGGINTVLLIASVPQSSNNVSKALGNNTLTIYLSHAMVFFFCQKYMKGIQNNITLTVVLGFVIIACLFVFSRQSYVKVFIWFLDKCKAIVLRGKKSEQSKGSDKAET